MRILWVEDSSVLIKTLNLFCEKYKVKQVHITDIDEFCSTYIDDMDDNDLIVLDILFDKTGMRDIEGRGYQALESMKISGKTSIPVVILTVLDKKEVKLKTVKYANVIQIVQKPVTPAELEKALKKAIAWKKQHKKVV